MVKSFFLISTPFKICRLFFKAFCSKSFLDFALATKDAAAVEAAVTVSLLATSALDKYAILYAGAKFF